MKNAKEKKLQVSIMPIRWKTQFLRNSRYGTSTDPHKEAKQSKHGIKMSFSSKYKLKLPYILNNFELTAKGSTLSQVMAHFFTIGVCKLELTQTSSVADDVGWVPISVIACCSGFKKGSVMSPRGLLLLPQLPQAHTPPVEHLEVWSCSLLLFSDSGTKKIIKRMSDTATNVARKMTKFSL